MPRRPSNLSWPHYTLLLLALFLLAHLELPHSIIQLLQPSTPSCPLPWESPPPLEPQTFSNQCVELNSNHSEFTISLCADRNLCNVGSIFIISLNRTSWSNDYPVDPDSNQDEWVKRTKGPNTFLVLFDGAVREGGERAVYEGGGKWRFDYNLGNGGSWELRILWLYRVSFPPPPLLFSIKRESRD